MTNLERLQVFRAYTHIFKGLGLCTCIDVVEHDDVEIENAQLSSAQLTII